MSGIVLGVSQLGFAARGKRILDDVSFAIPRGRSTVILGPNGAGKSVLLRLCHGLLQPSTGRIERCGLGEAMVFQRPVLLRRSALANVVHALALKGMARTERRMRALAALAGVGLDGLAQQPARSLSGGEQQRLATVRAGATSPAILYLDEPTASLDPASTAEIERMMGAFADAGMTCVMTTHDLAQARRMAAHIIFLHGGRLLEDAPAAQFFGGPQTQPARDYLAGKLNW